MRWLLTTLWIVVLIAPALFAQDRNSFQIPAEYDNYMSALNTRDPAKRAGAMEVFLAWYPNSVLRTEALQHAMAAWQAANQPDKAGAIAGKLLQTDPGNVHALAYRVYALRARALQGDNSVLGQMVAAAEQGLAALSQWQKPAQLGDAAFQHDKQRFTAQFKGALGYFALQAKDYDRARRYLREAVAADPANLQDVYQLAVAQLEGSPLDALGFWYAARSIAIARAAKSDAAASEIDRYARSRYRIYRGSEEGWKEIVARAAPTDAQPPANFAKSIPRALTPAEAAVVVVEENDPGSLSFADWALVLRHRDASAANRAAAEKVWTAILDKQEGGSTRLKMPVKVISATPDVIEAALTDQAQRANEPDLHIVLARPLAPLPAAGANISIIGTLSEYHAQPFKLVMTGAELAEESLPVAGGGCADPRPQMCTREYRPACGLHRDGSRKTYGSACTACSDPEVVSQAAGACP
jgi:tetratricopeptide (TPR) repeat protein